MIEIEKVRSIQEKCIQLHVVPPPLVLLKLSKNNKTIYFNKSNSFVRNAYNIVAYYIGQCLTQNQDQYADNYINIRSATIPVNFQLQSIVHSPSTNGFAIQFGDGTTKDTINDYALENPVSWDRDITYHSPIQSFDNVERLQINKISTTIKNISGSNQQVSEVVASRNTGSEFFEYTLIRDVFPTITLANNESLTAEYQLELKYP